MDLGKIPRIDDYVPVLVPLRLIDTVILEPLQDERHRIGQDDYTEERQRHHPDVRCDVRVYESSQIIVIEYQA